LEAALRVLADLSDDGRLSRAEGIPALAGLIGAQYSDGGFSESLRVQALAAWALGEAAASGTRLPWIPEATLKAAEYLNFLRLSRGSQRSADDALADAILELLRERGQTVDATREDGAVERCADPGESLNRMRTSLDPSVARLIDRIVRSLPPPRSSCLDEKPGRIPVSPAR
jgi:hypothetical protein